MCDSTARAAIALPASSAAPANARAFLRASACAEHHRRVLDDAELLLSELVTNALVHGTGSIDVALDCDEAIGLLVTVGDTAPGLPRIRRGDLHALGGRGLAMVDALADTWGVEEVRAGKQVWFRLS